MVEWRGCRLARSELGEAWIAGVRARQQGIPREARPDFHGSTALEWEWDSGWQDGAWEPPQRVVEAQPG
jgi:hypothetical protein